MTTPQKKYRIQHKYTILHIGLTILLLCSYSAYIFGIEHTAIIVIFSLPLLLIGLILAYKDLLFDSQKRRLRDVRAFCQSCNQRFSKPHKKKNAIIMLTGYDHNGAFHGLLGRAQLLYMSYSLRRHYNVNIQILDTGKKENLFAKLSQYKREHSPQKPDVLILAGHGNSQTIGLGYWNYDSNSLYKILQSHLSKESVVILDSCKNAPLAAHCSQKTGITVIGTKKSITPLTQVAVSQDQGLCGVSFYY